MKGMYAITGTVFFSIFLVTLVVYGDETVRKLAVSASLIAGYSQFVAQDDSQIAHKVSLAAAYLSMILGIIALTLL